MKSVRWLISYIFVALLGLWMAFAISAKFMAPAHSQETPSNGELPEEFMKEVESTQAPSQPPQQDGSKKRMQNLENVESQNNAPNESVPAAKGPSAQRLPVPPPPGSEAPVGEGVTAPESMNDFIQAEDYKYDPTGKRDPFKIARPMRVTHSETKVDVTDPLQRWELDRLTVVGILWDVRSPRAMVRDPDGALYTISKNTKIGRNEGFVVAIREGEVVVVEMRYDEGQTFKETRVMELKK